MQNDIVIGIISATREFIECASYVADQKKIKILISETGLEASVEHGQRMEKENVDVVIAWRAGAEILRKTLNIPVLTVQFTAYDLIAHIKDAKTLGNKILVTAYRSKPPHLDLLSQIFDVKITACIYNNSKELEYSIKQAKTKEYDVIIGGGITLRLAKIYGLKGVAYRPAVESMESAFDDAIAIARIGRQKHQCESDYSSIIDAFNEGVVSINENGVVSSINQFALKALNLDVGDVVGKNFRSIFQSSSIDTVLATGNALWGTIEVINNDKYITNYVPLINQQRPIGVVLMFKDISTLIKEENQVRRSLIRKHRAKYKIDDFIYKCDSMKRMINKVKTFSKTDATVLISGETGTGKEIIAHSIHQLSNRKKGSFISINCAAIPDNLLESELFGYEQGAFTGSKKGGKIGLFELAHDGTIFLDEIGSMPVGLQSSLLRVLQEREVMRIGGERLIPIDVRVIAAANQNLPKAVKEGVFREDLYFRLSVLTVFIPPLRERLADLDLIVDFLIEKCSRQFKTSSFKVPELFIERLKRMRWPGNIRQLQNFIEKMVILSEGNFSSDVFDDIYQELEYYSVCEGQEDDKLVSVTPDIVANKIMDDEARTILNALEKSKLNKKKAADYLGISRTTLWRKMQTLKIKI